MGLYQEDFYRWTVEQSKLLRSIELEGLDSKNLAEEIASLGRHERKELRTHFNVLLGHLLKWDLLPQERSKLWQVTIDSERREILWILRDSPSLKDNLNEIINDSYGAALYLVILETSIDSKDLPKDCPYTIEQILDLGFPTGIDKDLD
ncbi:DUF29 domain-containing protein [Pseudanabaena sp. 'Roaring Creek']|uniref:DUF29 domain-containing protein n=1 Tax=Pseudanabaena sp. 'Roaring Creek' TaxID=1681830 RepID=UPI0006D77E62|nr:DUF29 domain-containing protein [Pseudanabaena sp. 'Roaring Creek']